MRLFSILYERAMRWAAHRHAPWYLAGLSFAESSFFPVPPDVMLAPMALANPEKAWRYAALTTAASVIGGVLGYLIGVFAFELVEPLIRQANYWDEYEQTRAWFAAWGFWAVFLAGFSPIPYKVFTITAGVVSMAVIPFLIASLVGRGARFCLVACVMAWGGRRMESALRAYIDRIGWVIVVLALVVYLIAKA
jgi:membrane protein YqaA with SNARE-associated domain